MMRSQKPETKSQLQIKVCGLTKLNQIKELIGLKVDFLGFIFYEKSPRYVLNHLNVEQISEINHQGKVGVFVNESIEKIIEISEKAKLNFIQLHGDENEDYISELRQQLNPRIEIIKVVRINSVILNETKCSEESLRFFVLRNNIDYILFDTDSKAYGGTGKTFDWNILNKIEIPLPYFLSGGISLENVEELKNFVKVNQQENKNLNKLSSPFAIDINSKFEIEAGNKDLEKIKTFINLIGVTK
jgi:phosphoribosylanthranilate isomerase